MCAGHRTEQAMMMKWIGEGYAALAGDNKETADADADDPAADPDKKKRKKRKRSTAPSLPMEKCVPLLLNLRLAPQENEEGTVRLDAAGVRTVHHLLRFKDDLVSKSVMDGILTGLDADELEALASDGLGSQAALRTARTGEQAKVLVGCVAPLVSSGYLLESKGDGGGRRRGGSAMEGSRDVRRSSHRTGNDDEMDWGGVCCPRR